MAEKKIGKDTFRVSKMGAREAQRLLIRIGKMLGPGLEAFTQAIATVDRERSAMHAISGILSKADPEEVDALLVDLCQQASINVHGAAAGQYDQVVFDHHLDHDLLMAWQVAGFVLEVNFRDFFAAAAETGLGKAVTRSAVSTPRS